MPRMKAAKAIDNRGHSATTKNVTPKTSILCIDMFCLFTCVPRGIDL